MAKLDQRRSEGLFELAEIVAWSSESVLSTLLQCQVEIRPVEVRAASLEDIKNELRGRCAAMKTSFVRGLVGDLLFLMYIPDASAVVNLMMGGEPTRSEDLPEDGLDALTEATNQIMGTCSTGLGDRLRDSISNGPAEVQEVDLSDPDENLGYMIAEDNVALIQYTLSIEGMLPTEYFQLIPMSAATVMADAFRPSEEMSQAMIDDIFQSKEEATSPRTQHVPLPAAPAAAAPRPAGAAAPVPQPAAAAGGAAASFAAPGAAGAVPQVQYAPAPTFEAPNIQLILDIELPISVRLGEAEMLLEDVLRLSPGSIIELGQSADEPVDLLVNNRRIARGEVVVVDSNFGLRITSVESALERIKSLR
ncbi:MAG: flagellar motor switch protein FliN [Candidatus Schekmanbacteria bacterium]|nr:flagellar motor switch protein FliN [Candidatus Schekmanbacteria bacterium]